MSEMIERAARAIYELEQKMSSFEFPGASALSWNSPNFIGHDTYCDKARAAIEAMRTPTEAMSLAAMETKGQMTYSDVWIAMIDAALSEKP